MALSKWQVTMVKGAEERHYLVSAPKGCGMDAEYAARKRWEEEFGPTVWCHESAPKVTQMKEIGGEAG